MTWRKDKGSRQRPLRIPAKVRCALLLTHREGMTISWNLFQTLSCTTVVAPLGSKHPSTTPCTSCGGKQMGHVSPSGDASPEGIGMNGVMSIWHGTKIRVAGKDLCASQQKFDAHCCSLTGREWRVLCDEWFEMSGVRWVVVAWVLCDEWCVISGGRWVVWDECCEMSSVRGVAWDEWWERSGLRWVACDEWCER